MQRICQVVDLESTSGEVETTAAHDDAQGRSAISGARRPLFTADSYRVSRVRNIHDLQAGAGRRNVGQRTANGHVPDGRCKRQPTDPQGLRWVRDIDHLESAVVRGGENIVIDDVGIDDGVVAVMPPPQHGGQRSPRASAQFADVHAVADGTVVATGPVDFRGIRADADCRIAGTRNVALIRGYTGHGVGPDARPTRASVGTRAGVAIAARRSVRGHDVRGTARGIAWAALGDIAGSGRRPAHCRGREEPIRWACLRRAVATFGCITRPRGGTADHASRRNRVGRAGLQGARALLGNVADASGGTADGPSHRDRVRWTDRRAASAGFSHVTHARLGSTTHARWLKRIRWTARGCARALLGDIAGPRAGSAGESVRSQHVRRAVGSRGIAGLGDIARSRPGSAHRRRREKSVRRARLGRAVTIFRRIADARGCAAEHARESDHVRWAGLQGTVTLFGEIANASCGSTDGPTNRDRVYGTGRRASGAGFSNVACTRLCSTRDARGLKNVGRTDRCRARTPLDNIARSRAGSTSEGARSQRVRRARFQGSVAMVRDVTRAGGGTTDRSGPGDSVRGTGGGRAVAELGHVARAAGRPARDAGHNGTALAIGATVARGGGAGLAIARHTTTAGRVAAHPVDAESAGAFCSGSARRTERDKGGCYSGRRRWLGDGSASLGAVIAHAIRGRATAGQQQLPDDEPQGDPP